MRFKLIIDEDKSEEVVATVKRRSSLTAEIEKICLEYSGDDKIPVYGYGEVKLMDVSDIECVTVLDGKTYAVCGDGKKYGVKMRLYEIEEILPKFFIKINKSAIANERRIKSFKVNFSGAVDIIFNCGYRDYVSRRCFSDIKRRFDL